MQNFAQHPGRGVSLLSSIKFHSENIRGSLVQVVKHRLLFLLARYRSACGDASQFGSVARGGSGTGEGTGGCCATGGHAAGPATRVPCSPGHRCSAPRNTGLPPRRWAAGTQRCASPPNSSENALLRQGLFFHLYLILPADEGVGAELDPSLGWGCNRSSSKPRGRSGAGRFAMKY